MKKLFWGVVVSLSLIQNIYATESVIIKNDNNSNTVFQIEQTRGTYYKYKYINGVLYKRVWSDTEGWLEDEWHVA